MSDEKLPSREELTKQYLDAALNGQARSINVETLIREVEKIVDCLMRAREVDLNGEFYIILEDHLSEDNDG